MKSTPKIEKTVRPDLEGRSNQEKRRILEAEAEQYATEIQTHWQNSKNELANILLKVGAAYVGFVLLRRLLKSKRRSHLPADAFTGLSKQALKKIEAQNALLRDALLKDKTPKSNWKAMLQKKATELLVDFVGTKLKEQLQENQKDAEAK